MPALPATTALVAVTAEPATTALATVATEVPTPALATVPDEPATAALATVPTDPATAVLAEVAADPATAVEPVVATESTTAHSVPGDLVTPVILPQFGPCVPGSISGHTDVVETKEYAPGRLVDVFGDATDDTVLLWHGTQTDARTTLRPFATLLAGHGFHVIVPDWDSHAADNGRADLLGSLRYAAADGEFAVIGWSLGGTAAASVALDADHFDTPVTHVICLAGAFGADDPMTGRGLLAGATTGTDRIPLILLHGVADDVVPIAVSEDFASALDDWPLTLITLDADHGSIAGAAYDADADRYRAADDSATSGIVGDVVERISSILRQS